MGLENFSGAWEEELEPLFARGGVCGCRWRPSSWALVTGGCGHVCGVGFIRGSLDLHRYDRGRHKLLGLEDLDTVVSHGDCMMLWSLDLKLSRGTVNMCYACMNLLYCVEMFV